MYAWYVFFPCLSLSRILFHLTSLSNPLAQPLKIITGRGAHSVGQESVLKPALQKTLIEDGWSVSTWDAGLTVRGKRAG